MIAQFFAPRFLAQSGEVGGVPFEFVAFSEFAEFLEGEQALGRGGEGDGGERPPEVFADGGGDGLFAEEGELGEGVGVLKGGEM